MFRSLAYYATRRRENIAGAVQHGSLRTSFKRPGFAGLCVGRCVVSGWAVNLETRSAAEIRALVGGIAHYPRPESRGDIWLAYSPEHNIPAEVGFSIDLDLPPGPNRICMEMENVDGSWSTVSTFSLYRLPRLSFGERGANRPRPDASPLNAAEIRLRSASMAYKPTFAVIVDSRSGGQLQATLDSIHGQSYPGFHVGVLTQAGDAVEPPAAGVWQTMTVRPLRDIDEDFVLFVEAGQQLTANALFELATAINAHPDLDLAYGDEVRDGEIFRKPSWSPDYLETFNYVGFAACFRSSIARDCFNGHFHAYDFALRFTERTARILHIPRLLGHDLRPAEHGQSLSPDLVALDVAALQRRLLRTGRRGVVREHGQHKGCFEIQVALAQHPLVSIIIPTAGKTVVVGNRQIDLVINVVRQIWERSTYNKVEIIIVDNGDLSPDQIQVLDEAECKRITYRDPVFNVSRKLNLGASIARGEMLLLLNDDIEILTPSWIERLLEHFEKPHVGIVGAKLLYLGGRIQHAGIVFQSGEPIHIRRHFSRHEAGYFFGTCGVRNYMAVTGACMMTPAGLYRALGGFDEALAITYNDVDFCLKVHCKGLHIVYAPGAELTHMESQTRVSAPDQEGHALYRRRWAGETTTDEFFNEEAV